MLKKPKLSGAQWKRKYDRLLKLLFALSNNSRSGFVELGLKSEEGEQLRTLVRNEKRHEWKKVGMTEHLMAIHLNPPISVGYVAEDSPRKFRWVVEGRKFVEGTERSLSRAKAKLELYFETISATD